MLYNCQEITLEDNNGKKPKFTLVGQTHISENTRNYDRLPAIRPVIGTINTVHYIITTCLTNLLFRLIENNFTILTLILTKLRLNPVKYLTKVTNLLALTPHRYLLPFV